jgi:peptidoglycan/xylan/chitin deacetylase (PgdA/CDA1 family)
MKAWLLRPRSWIAGLSLLGAAACATAPPAPPAESVATPPPTTRPAPPPVARVEPAPEPVPTLFTSEDFVIVTAKAGDTAEGLAAQHLGAASKSWMIEDYMGTRTFTPGQRVFIPRRPWNLTGVEGTGYQIVPILCYHNLAAQSKGRLTLGASQFEQQMRYLKSEGYRVISLAEFVEWLQGRRQLPKRSVVLTFDDGYRAFQEFAYPVLKELGFTATLFVYTDYVGAGRNALGWDDLKALEAAGFDVQAHSKTHADLRRAAGESDAQYARRMQLELAEPLKLFQRHLGRTSERLAYPYGRVDDDVVAKAKEYGYVVGFTVRRQGSPAFVQPLRINRSQVYSEMSLEDFAKNLNVFHGEDLR